MLITSSVAAALLGALCFAAPSPDASPPVDPSPATRDDGTLAADPGASADVDAAEANPQAAPPAESGAPDAEVVADAERMYRIGEAHFAAADYAAAIETWTAVLSHLPNTEAVRPIRLDLLYNIASAHEQEFEVDANPRHLRQAMVLFERYVEERGDTTATEDAQRRLDVLREKIAAIEEQEAASNATFEPESTDPRVDDDRGKRDRLLGIGLVAGGGAATVAGVVMLAVGSRFRPNAKDEVAGANIGDDDALIEQANAFVDDETRKGTIVMAIGGTVGGIGLAAAGVGIYYLVRGRRARARTARLRLDIMPRRGGVAVTGRF